ncbi:hypothetical protein, partial [Burkholderia vietnamiensis]|uniref:hypothetical protein n=1 Tax=Burkholderia vietnamiensis TaxID=60552 RepID=UPI001CF443E7
MNSPQLFHTSITLDNHFHDDIQRLILDNFNYRCYTGPAMPTSACLRQLRHGDAVLRGNRKTSQEVTDCIECCFGGGTLTLVAVRPIYTGKVHENQGDP